MTDLTPKEKVELKIKELKNQLEDLHLCLEHTTELLYSFFSMAFDLEYDITIAKVNFEKEYNSKSKAEPKEPKEPKTKAPRKLRGKKSAPAPAPIEEIGEEIPFVANEIENL